MIPPVTNAAYGWTGVLGWTLLHFLWQGALIALLLWCALGLVESRAARLRYALCCAALALLPLVPAATFVSLGGIDALHSRAPAPTVSSLVDVHAALDGGSLQPWTVRLAYDLDAAAPILPWIWFAGVTLCAARLGTGLLAARRMTRAATPASDDPVREIFTAVRAELGITKLVRLLQSTHVDVPTVVGWLSPAVLLPLGCFAGLSSTQVEALLAHELAHIRRHDYLVSVLQCVIESLLFYHPAVWWVSRQARRERECCCDEIAATVSGNRLEYARALSLLEERRPTFTPAVPLAANGGVLPMRIKRLLGYPQGSATSQLAAVAILFAILTTGGIVLVRSARAQTNDGPDAQAHLTPAILTGEKHAQSPIAPPHAVLTRTAQDTQPSPRTAPAQPDSTLSGVVIDPTGAVMPRVNLTATNARTAHQSTGQTDDSGNFTFTLPAGQYTLAASALGFKTTLAQVGALTPSDPVHLTLRLPLGATSQNLLVSARQQVPAPGEETSSKPTGPIRVSGGVAAGALISHPSPVYPPEAKTAGIQGAVVLHAVISQEGNVETLTVVSGPTALQVSAMDAVRQWKYKPYLLNGKPVEVATTVTVNFSLAEDAPAPPSPGTSRDPNRPLRVSAGVMAAQATHQVPPQYPPDAKAAGIQGTVVLRAAISKDGAIEDLQVMSGPPELTTSATDAVRQWTYKPFLLNGEPTAVETTINVNYTLAN